MNIKKHWPALALFIVVTLLILWININYKTHTYDKVKILINQEQYEKALDVLIRMQAKNPETFFLDLYLGEVYENLGNPKVALKYYLKAYTMAIKSKSDVLIRVALFKEAKSYEWLGEYQKAAYIYQQLLSDSLSIEDREIAKYRLNKAMLAIYNNADSLSVLIEPMSINDISKLLNFCPVIPEPIAINTTSVFLSEVINRAQNLLIKNRAKEAYDEIEPYLNKYEKFYLPFIAAKSMALAENPKSALKYYEKSHLIAATDKQKKMALFGKLKMQIWLIRIKDAYITIKDIDSYSLTSNETKQLREFKIKLATYETMLEQRSFINNIEGYLNRNQPREAFSILCPILKVKDDYSLDMLAAETRIMIGQPLDALYFYEKAYHVTSNLRQKKLALFAIARMNFWLGNYVRAEALYRKILKQYKLSYYEYSKALAGVIKSMTYYNHPRAASMLINKVKNPDPEYIVASAQATLWSNKFYLTKDILQKYDKILKKIRRNSGLGRDIQDLRWQTEVMTHPNILSPDLFISEDSETFKKQRATLEYNHYWNRFFQTRVGLDHIEYKQFHAYKLNAKGFYLSQVLQPTSNLIITGAIEPREYHNLSFNTPERMWQPFLWAITSGYTPNDYISVQGLVQKEIVETFPAFANRISDVQYAGTINVSPIPYLQFNLAGSQLSFSDSNIRKGYYAAVSYLLFPHIGFSLIRTMRGYSNKFTSPNYFSPSYYKANLWMARLSRKFGATLHYYLDGGYGRQYITPTRYDDTVSSPTYQWGFGLNGPVTNNIILNLYFADIHQVSAFIGSQNYRYQYGNLGLTILL